MLAVLGAGCTAVPMPAPVPVEQPVTVPTPAPAPAWPGAAAVAALAQTQLGVRYRAGGADPQGFDCSGLVQWAYGRQGVTVPRTTEAQRAWFTPVPREALQAGDVVFFQLPQPHVGIYVGDGEFVHAPGTGRGVERARLDAPWFILGFAGGGRLSSPP